MSSFEQALAQPRSGSWRRKPIGFLSLARISNSPTVASDVLAGAALAGAFHRRVDGALVLLACALILFYTAGMVLNDLCDYAIDCRERPERPLPSGVVSRRAAAVSVVALFGVGAALLVPVGTTAFVGGVALIGMIVFYDVWHKANPLSPLVMALCRLLAYVTAFLAFATRPSAALTVWGGVLVGYLIGLTYIAKSEARPNFTRYWPVILLFLPIPVALARPSLPVVGLVALFALWVAYSISFVYRPSGRNIGGAIGRLIAGISLLDSLVLAAQGASVWVGLALLAFGLTLILQRRIKGT